MKNFYRTIIMIMLLGMLASCSPATSRISDKQQDDTEVVTLQFKALTWIKLEQEVQRDLINKWNTEHPEIQVELIQADWANASQELLTGFETGDVPDIFHYAQPIIADWKNDGYLSDMSVMLTEEDKADVNPDVWAGLTADDGTIVGIPIQYEVDATFYNIEVFKKNNITPPTLEDPWTFDELVEVARKLQGSESPDFMGMSFVGVDKFGRKFTEIWAPKIGDPLVYKDNEGEYYVKLNDDSISFIQKVKGLIDEGLIGTNMLASAASTNAMTEFLNGKSAMIVGYGCWMRSRLHNESEGATMKEWGVASPIAVNDVNIYGYIQTLSVPVASKHKEEAFEFLKWYWQKENVLAVAKAATIMPGRNSAILDPSLDTPEDSWNLVQDAVQNNVIPEYVSIPGWGQFTEGIGLTLFSDYWIGSITLDEFISRFENEGTRILQENN